MKNNRILTEMPFPGCGERPSKNKLVNLDCFCKGNQVYNFQFQFITCR